MNKKSPLYIIGFMVVVCVVFGTGVSVVHNATRDMLEKNKRFHLNRIICRAFLITSMDESPEAYAEAIAKQIQIAQNLEGDRVRNLYRQIDVENKVVAVGFDFSGMGFWDRINGIIVFTPDLEKIINIQFFDHKETPGLGARIEEKWFTDQFKGIRVAWDKAVPDRVIFGAASAGSTDYQIDAITGATQTSMALKRFLNQELERIRTFKLEKSGWLESVSKKDKKQF
ncbi:MAG: FMN-binding protein [Thermodesulfobacteriota bacterium]|nr:FMN-binding protein [Thermodesulfobacteriota bacterium]